MNGTLPFTPALLADSVELLPDHRLLEIRAAMPLVVLPGQFIEISLPGVGGFPVSACAVDEPGTVRACVRRAGRVTGALFGMKRGARLGVRGPFGRGFPLAEFARRDALLIAGGLGMAPLRALLQALSSGPGQPDRIILLYGARDPESMLFRQELNDLAARGRLTLRLSVDFAVSLPGLAAGVVCKIGLVNELLAGLDVRAERTTAAVCGPPPLYRCVLGELAALGVPPERIFATLERRMRCGIGECCHCVAGGVYICRDGPVFSLAELNSMPGAI